MSGEQILYNRPTFPAQLNMAHPLTRGLVGCWVLNDPSGLRAWDSSPYGNHGTLTGFPEQPRPTHGLPFDGTNDYIVDSGNSILNFTSGDFEFVIWLKIPAGATKDRTILSRGTDNTDGYFFYFDGSGNKQFYTCQAAAQQSTIESTTPVYDTWEMWSIRRVATSVKLFKNAIECTYSAVGTHTNPLTSARSLTLACKNSASPAQFLQCSIGGVLVYNRTLITTERLELYLDPYGMFLK